MTIIKNSLWNYFGSIASLAALLIATPIYIRVLGLERFGVLAIIWAVLTPVGMLNAGVAQAAVKFIASLNNKNESTQISQYISASFLLNLAVGLLGALIAFIASAILESKSLKIPPYLIAETQTSLKLAGGVWLIAQISITFRAISEGHQRHKKVAIADAFSATLGALCTSIGAIITNSLNGYILGQLFATTVTATYWIRSGYALARLRLSLSGGLIKIKEVTNFSGWQILNAGVSTISNLGDRYILSIFYGPGVLGAYSTGLRAQSLARIAFSSVNNVLFPAASSVSHYPGQAEKLILQATKYVSIWGGFSIGLGAIFSERLIELWLGVEIGSQIGVAIPILLLTLIFEIPSATLASFMNARGHTKPYALNNVLTAICTLGLMLFMGPTYGPSGVAASCAIGLVVTRVPLHAAIYHQHFKAFTSLYRFFTATYGIGIVCALSSAAAITIDLLIASTQRGGVPPLLISLLSVTIYGTITVCLLYPTVREEIHFSKTWILNKLSQGKRDDNS